MTPVIAIPTPLAFDLSDLVGLVLFLLFLVVGGIKSAATKAAERRKARPSEDGDEDDAEGGEDVDAEEEAKARAARSVALREEIAEAVRRMTGMGPAARPAPPATPPRPAARPPTPPRVRPPAHVRRKGLVDDAHVELSSRLPTSGDMPGARAAQGSGHGHLAEIGRDRGTSPAHLGAAPSPAAKAPHDHARLSPRDLLKSGQLLGKDRLRAGLLWVEVLGPPRSRRVPRR